MKFLFLMLAALAALGADRAGAEPISAGLRADVGGHSLYIDCRGQGRPSVILDAGLGKAGDIWRGIQQELADITRVCTYDRAGYGRSDPGPEPRTSSRIAAELRTLLARARIPPPYVLVGHSFGGYNARAFAGLYPQDTAGLVLVDAPHEDQAERFFRTYLLGLMDSEDLLQPLLRSEWLAEIPDAHLALVAILMGWEPKTLRAVLGEAMAFHDSSRELQALGSQAEIPLVVIMHGQRVLPNDPVGDRLEQQWLALQEGLVRRHRDGTFVIASKSDHDILAEQPELVVDAVRMLVEKHSPAP